MTMTLQETVAEIKALRATVAELEQEKVMFTRYDIDLLTKIIGLDPSVRQTRIEDLLSNPPTDVVRIAMVTQARIEDLLL